MTEYKTAEHSNSMSMRNQRIPQATIDRVNQYDIRELASRYVELSKASVHELAGPCPKCGGIDRFFVGEHFWGCRKCPQSKTHGAINFVMWVRNCSFQEAVTALIGNTLLPALTRLTEPIPSAAPTVTWRTPQWQQRVRDLAQRAHHCLLTDTEGEQGRAYLLCRGIHCDSWQAYQLGYSPRVSIPGTQGQHKVPAIVIPWIVQGMVRGIRYRFLDVQKGHKQTAYHGSSFTGSLYGGHAFGGNIPSLSTLLLVEGELNAVSCWQVSRATHLDVLSLGSESTHLTAAMVAKMKQYRHIIAWLDRSDIVKNKIAQIPGAFGVQSPDGCDANDLLSQGLLTGFLATLRIRIAQSPMEREALLWDLWDAVEAGGVDRSTADVINRLAAQVGG